MNGNELEWKSGPWGWDQLGITDLKAVSVACCWGVEVLGDVQALLFYLNDSLVPGRRLDKEEVPLSEREAEPWRRTSGYTPNRSICDPEGVSWSQCGEETVLPALLRRLVNAVRTLSGFSVMRRMRDKVCSSSISLDLIIFLMMQQNDSVLILDLPCKRGEQNADLIVKSTDGRWLL